MHIIFDIQNTLPKPIPILVQLLVQRESSSDLNIGLKAPFIQKINNANFL